ncbi:3-keto-5-aminohexanoate cleavage protein [Paracandidimonas lactea]|uniref:3-keto-5-aminohexanoate cleavage protein n=1 Tax=Paracandidimonas lactea TaxID=2895524 RepID=UPI001F22ACE9|nr:3-keto-5-aminohexanoate cleavage protein [Paracandidimonas lactea]
MRVSHSPVIITVAPNGARVRTADHPQVPISPESIADTVAECLQAGAAIAHLHARAPDESPAHDVDTFREIVIRVRARAETVLQLSLGTRGFTVEQAVAPLSLQPEMVSLPLRLEGPDIAHAKAALDAMAAKVAASGAIPEMSVYNEAMLETALALIDAGAVQKPYCFGLILGAPDSFEAGARKLMNLAARLPQGAYWWCAKGGRYQLELSALAIALGGHVRVGFEDSVLDVDGSRQAPGNAYLVQRIADLCKALGRPVATAAQTRTMLGL